MPFSPIGTPGVLHDVINIESFIYVIYTYIIETIPPDSSFFIIGK